MKTLTKTTIEKVLLESAHAQLEFMATLPSTAQLLQCVAAFANCAGGRIVVGFDPGERRVLGCPDTHDRHIVRSIQGLKPVPMVQCYRLPCQGQELLVLDVAKNPDPVHTSDGELFIRVGTQIQSMGNLEPASQEMPQRRWVLPVGSLLMVFLLTIQLLAVFFLEAQVAALFGVLAALMTVVFLGVLNWHSEQQQSQTREIRIQQIQKITKTQDGQLLAQEQPLDLSQWLQVNLETLDEAYAWNKTQARQSFWLTMVLALLGVCLMALPTVLSLLGRVSVEVAVLAAIGGVAAECIAVAALAVYRHNLRQLHTYHEALLENQRFLRAVSLAEQLGTDKEAVLKALLAQAPAAGAEEAPTVH